MDVAQRINTLARAGRGSREIAAILGITTDEVYSASADPSGAVAAPPVVSNIAYERDVEPSSIDLGADEQRWIGPHFTVRGPGIFKVFAAVEYEPGDAIGWQMTAVDEAGEYDPEGSAAAPLSTDPFVYVEEITLSPSQVARRRVMASAAGNPGPVAVAGGVVRVTRVG